MSDILYNVRTVYQTDTSGATQGMGAMSGAASRLGGVLDGLKGAARAALGYGVMAGSLAAVGAIGLLAHGIANVNGQLDSTAVGIAGMVQAAEVDGTQGAAGWASSMGFAEQAMQQIRVDAAALPGTADDFIEVFRAGLAPALESGLEAVDVAHFTNRFGAVGIALRVDAPQIGRDLNLMLSGRAGAHVNMWNRLKSTIGKTAAEFNAMSASARRMAIDRAMDRYQPMIDAYANTWEAISSTTESYGRDLLRLATNPAFEVVKKELRSMNDWWHANQTAINEVANGVGLRLVDAYKTAHGEAYRLFGVMDQWSAGPMGQRILGLGDSLRRGASSLATRAGGYAMAHPGEVAGMAGAGAGLAMGIPGLGLLAGGLVSFAGHTEAAGATLGNLTSAGGSVLNALFGLAPVVLAVDNAIGSFLAGALPSWSLGMSNLAHSVDGAVATVAPAIGGMLGALGPVFEILGVAIGGITTIIATGLGESIRAMASATASLANMIKGVVTEMGGWLARHGITVASTSNFLRESAATTYGALTTPFRMFGTFMSNFGRSIGSVDPHTPGAQRQNANGSAGRGFFDESSTWDMFRRGYDAAGGRTFRPPGAPGASTAPAPHVETLAERIAAMQATFHDSIERLRTPLMGAMATNTLGAAAGRRATAHPGNTHVTVHIHQTINTNDDPDRVLYLTRRGVHMGLYAPLESSGVRVTH